MKMPEVKFNWVDRVVNYFSPVKGARRLQARAAVELFGSFDGASKNRRSMQAWQTEGLDADSDILEDLPTLRERSRDLVRNIPLACGAIQTKVNHTVGTGLQLRSHIDRDALGMSDDAADALEKIIQREWRLFWDSKNVDTSRICTGTDITRMVYQQSKENGDVGILLPFIERPGVVYRRTLQVIEADRICNKDDELDSDTLAGGIKKDENGAPEEYHILEGHPGNLMASASKKWRVVPAFGKNTGLRNFIHLYRPTRPGQSRGVPDLAPVIEAFKQLGRYTEAEVMAAVVSSYFTVFIEKETGGVGAGNTFGYQNLDGNAGSNSNSTGTQEGFKMGPGMIVDLGGAGKINTANPGRPNANFDPFVMAVLRQIGAALGIPFEILIKHFTASYSASRAAMIELWKYIQAERKWLIDNFMRPVFEVWMWEAVAMGRVPAPGFFADPGIRQAYLGSRWIGPAKGQLDEVNAATAAEKRLQIGLTTLSDETVEMNGGDWESNHIQQVKEHNKRSEDGLLNNQPTDPVDPDEDDNNDTQGGNDE